MSSEQQQDEKKVTPLTKQRDAYAEREKIKTKFWNVLQEKWPSVRESCNKHWNNDRDAHESLFEKTVIREHIEVFEHGALMSVVIFGALRLTAHPKFHPFVDRYVIPLIRLTPPKKKQKVPTPKTNNSKNKIDMKAPKSAHVQSGRQFKSYLEQQRDAHKVKIHKASEAPHDIFVATVVGISATCFFMRPKQLRLDFEEAPLSPGRSFFSEHMCDDFIKIYQETDPQVFGHTDPTKDEDDSKSKRESNKYVDNTVVAPPDANLKSFEKFALHCILRSAYVQKRIEAGEPKPLVLPDSGPWENA